MGKFEWGASGALIVAVIAAVTIGTCLYLFVWSFGFRDGWEAHRRYETLDTAKEDG